MLDFVANYRKEFRFDLRLRALTGIPRRNLVEAAEEGFPYLPTGSHLSLDRQSREWIIEHLKQSVKTNAKALRQELSLLSQLQEERPTLRTFVAEAGIELEDVGKVGGWAALAASGRVRRTAARSRGGPPAEGRPSPAPPRQRRAHPDAARRPPARARCPSGERERRLLWMVLVTLWAGKAAPESLEEAWAGLRSCPALVDELIETLPILRDRISHVSHPLPDADVPLEIGATYARDEVLAAFGELRPGRDFSHQAGPWWHEPTQTDVLVHHAAQDREGLQPRDDVPGLRHQSRVVPLGVAEQDGGGVDCWPALPEPADERRSDPAGGS